MRWLCSLAALVMMLPPHIGVTQDSLCSPCVDPPLYQIRRIQTTKFERADIVAPDDMRRDLEEVLGAQANSGQSCPAIDEYAGIVSSVTEHFYDRTFNGLDWPSRVYAYRSNIRCEMDADELAPVVNQLLTELNASHTALYTQSDQHYWGINSFFSRVNAYFSGTQGADEYEVNFSGIWAEQNSGAWVASFVMEDSPAAEAGVRVGDELIAIDGEAFDPLGFNLGQNVLSVSSDGRSERNLTIQTTLRSVTRGFENATKASRRILVRDGKRIGYLHLWAGGPATLEILNEVVTAFASENLDSILIDMRGGYGGMNEDYLEELRTNPRLQEIPKYFLIDDSLRSGKELVVGVVKRDSLGVLVGSKTAGQYLAGLRVPLFDEKYLLYVATGDGPAPVIPGIGQIEGNGIEPDVFVESCRRYCAGVDPVYERAIDLIAGL